MKPVYKVSTKTRKRMSKSHMGKKHSPATIEKIRAAKMERDRLVREGILPAFRHSEATKAKLRKLALRQKRRHKFSKAERKKGNSTVASVADAKRLRKHLSKYNWS